MQPVFSYGCQQAARCSYNDPLPGSEMDGKAKNKIYYNRNYGATEKNQPKATDYEPGDMLQQAVNGVGIVSRWQYRPLSSDEYPNYYQADFASVVDDEHPRSRFQRL